MEEPYEELVRERDTLVEVVRDLEHHIEWLEREIERLWWMIEEQD